MPVAPSTVAHGKESSIKRSDIGSFFTGLVPLFALAHFGHHLLIAILKPLLPLIRDEFVIDYTQAGLLDSAFTLSYGFSQLPGGWLSDRIGPRLLILIGISGVALSGLLTGFSPNYFFMALFLVMLGMTGGGYHPASVPLVSASVEARNRGKALGLHQIGGTFSHFAAPLIATAIAAAIGWRGSFIGLAIPTIALGFLLYVLLGRRGVGSKTASGKVKDQSELPTAPGHWRRLVAFLSLSVAGHIVITSTITFTALFLVDRFGYSGEAAGASLSIVYFAGLFAGPVGGYLSDRFGSVVVLISASLLIGPIIILLRLVPPDMGSITSVGIATILLAIGIARYVRMPATESYAITQAAGRHRSTILGIYYFASRGGSGFTVPIMGYFIDHFGFDISFTVVGIAMLVVTLIGAVFLWGGQSSQPDR